MTALVLYKFINNNNIEYHWESNNKSLDVIIFVNHSLIKEFNDLLPDSILDEEGLECVMKDGYFAFWMDNICEYCGIHLEEVFEETERKKNLKNYIDNNQ